MSAAIPYQRYKLSVDEYHRMGERGVLKEDSRIELIDGELIEMAPIGSPHAALVAALTEELAQRRKSHSALLWVQSPVSLPPHSEPQPDVVLLKWRSDRYFDALPTAADVILLVEVAASSLEYDRGTKRALYARHGIVEFWIVDVENRKLEVYRDPSTSGYGTRLRPEFTEEVSPLALPEVRIRASELFPVVGS